MGDIIDSDGVKKFIRSFLGAHKSLVREPLNPIKHLKEPTEHGLDTAADNPGIARFVGSFWPGIGTIAAEAGIALGDSSEDGGSSASLGEGINTLGNAAAFGNTLNGISGGGSGGGTGGDNFWQDFGMNVAGDQLPNLLGGGQQPDDGLDEETEELLGRLEEEREERRKEEERKALLAQQQAKEEMAREVLLRMLQREV